MSTEMVDSRDIARIIRRNGLLIFLTVVLSAAIAIEIAFMSPAATRPRQFLTFKPLTFRIHSSATLFGGELIRPNRLRSVRPYSASR